MEASNWLWLAIAAGLIAVVYGIFSMMAILRLPAGNARMQEIATTYPSIARVVDITATYNTPATVEGRHIYALKISDNVGHDEDEQAASVAGGVSVSW